MAEVLKTGHRGTREESALKWMTVVAFVGKDGDIFVCGFVREFVYVQRRTWGGEIC